MSDVIAYRIARTTTLYKADDIDGKSAAINGARWNATAVPMVYASLTRALAVLETVVHLPDPPGLQLPLDRYLVEITIPETAWNAREIFNPASAPDWDAIPGSASAVAWGSAWANERRSLVAAVPSVIVPEEGNVLLNPLHPDARCLNARIIGKWLYDPRIGATVKGKP